MCMGMCFFAPSISVRSDRSERIAPLYGEASKLQFDTVQLPGRFYKPRVLQGFLILFTEEKLKTRMDFACVPREPRTSPARFLLGVAGIFHETLAGHHA